MAGVNICLWKGLKETATLIERCSLALALASAMALSMSSCRHSAGRSARSIMISVSEKSMGPDVVAGFDKATCMR